MKSSNCRRMNAVIMFVALLACGLVSAEDVKKSTPDPLFDQGEFNFHTYTASYDQVNRPQFHFTSREGHINDPNGLVFYDDEWHLFFQHKGVKVWGHAVSTDLVHWEQLEHAIVPHKGHCPEKGQIWSGSAVVDWNNSLGKQQGKTKTMVAFFTHTQGNGFHQDGAYSTDRGRTFQLMGNLVPNQGKSKGERDPKVFWDPESKRWIMLMTAGVKAVFYSIDLVKWNSLGAYEGKVAGECPDLFQLPLDGDTSKMKWIITNGGSQYNVGHLEDGMWVADPGQRKQGFDYGKPSGNTGYAWQTFNQAPNGRVVQIGFLRNKTSDGMYAAHADLPFHQQMTIPVDLSLRTTADGIRLFRNPAPEIERLYLDSKEWNDITVTTANGDSHLGGLTPDLMDLTCEFTPGDEDKVTFDIRGVKVRYSQNDGKVRINNNSGKPGETTLPAGLDKNGRVKIRVLFDRTSFEIFINDGLSVASINCVPLNTKLSIDGLGSIIINKIMVNELKSIWPSTRASGQ